MKAKDRNEIKKLVAEFKGLRVAKADAPAAIDHAPYEHLHEGPDVASDPTMSFCPLCRQDVIVTRLEELVVADG